jgi:hypothetical protein
MPNIEHKQATYPLNGMTVTLSAPVQVAQWPNRRLADVSEAIEGQFLWYPQVARLADGELLAQIRLGGDTWQADLYCPIAFAWSGDEGATWSELLVASQHNGYGSLLLPSGDLLILPFLPATAPGGMVGPCNIIPRGQRAVRFVEDAVTVDGLLRAAIIDPSMDQFWDPQRPYRIGGFYFDGRPLKLDDGWLTTLYGKYDGDAEKKCTLHAAFSPDGFHWTVRATIAAADSPLGEHLWANSEAEICRLPDGRLLCVFRIENAPYGHCFSSDDGHTWTTPASMPPGVGTVEPRLAVTPSGVVTLCGGRPRFYLWFNADGTGKDWQGIDLFTHHNAHAAPTHVRFGGYRFDGSSAYGSVVPLDDASVLCIYDCFTDDAFGIYVVRATVSTTRTL